MSLITTSGTKRKQGRSNKRERLISSNIYFIEYDTFPVHLHEYSVKDFLYTLSSIVILQILVSHYNVNFYVKLFIEYIDYSMK